MRFQKVRERLIFASKWVRIYDDEVLMPDGSRGYYTRVASASAEGGAHVVPRLPDGRVLLIKANRYPAGEDIWEFPRGIPDPGESFEEAAKRELFEDSGLKVSKLSFLAYLRADGGILSTRNHVFVAEVPDGAQKDLRFPADEGIFEGRFMLPDDVGALIAAGDTVDGTALATLMLLRVQRPGALADG